nr:1345_t:CDS:2 [Entrophospora candida]
MGHSKKQKLHKIVQHVLPQIIIPSEPEKNPKDRSVQKKIQSNVHDHSRYAKVNEMYVDWKAAGFGSSQDAVSQAIYAESEKVNPNDEHLMQSSNPTCTYLNLIIDCAFIDPNTEKNSIAFGMAFILDPSKGIKLV